MRNEIQRDVGTSEVSLKTSTAVTLDAFCKLEQRKIYSGSRLEDLKGQKCEHYFHCAVVLTKFNSV